MKLQDLLTQGYESKIIKPEIQRARDIHGHVGNTLALINSVLLWDSDLHGSIPLIRYLKGAIDRGYARIIDGEVVLLPFTPSNEFLVHKRVFAASYLPRSIGLDGVFGDESPQHPTYLSLPRWLKKTHCGETRNNRKNLVLLTLDTSKLLERRTLFIDPDTINNHSLRESSLNELGKVLYVPGGIPKESVVDIRWKYGRDKNRELKF